LMNKIRKLFSGMTDCCWFFFGYSYRNIAM